VRSLKCREVVLNAPFFGQAENGFLTQIGSLSTPIERPGELISKKTIRNNSRKAAPGRAENTRARGIRYSKKRFETNAGKQVDIKWTI